jgi:glycosyltransferase involved in cell wall biosynthesis
MTNEKKQTFRILFCSMALTFGGEQKQMAKILSHVNRDQFQPIVCCIRQHGYIEQKILDQAEHFVSLGIKNRYNLLGEILGLYKTIKKYKINLIHTGIFGSEFAPLLTSVITRVPAVAFLTTTYDLEFRFPSGESSRFAYWKTRVFFFAHGIISRLGKIQYIAYTQVIKDSAVKNLHLPPDRVSLIPLGVDYEDFSKRLLSRNSPSSVKEELSLNGTYPVLLNVARLSPVKGQKDLISMMPLVLERCPNAKLLIAGDGSILPDLIALRDELGLQENVLFLGQRDDIPELLSICDIFVFCSYYEGLPGAVIEAITAEKPVVAFDISALNEVIQNNRTGIIISGRNTKAFSESVIKLAEHPEIGKELAEKAKTQITEQFNIKQNIKTLESLYTSILNNLPIKV